MYGPRERRAARGSVLDGLIGTILSQNTTNANSGRAFASLKHRFPTWDDVRVAPVRSIEAAIRSGGLARTKSRRIKEILQTIHRTRAETSLDHLRDASRDEVFEELTALPGVGPKTISCVLLFSLGRDDFPVDTHVHRVARRLAWIPQEATREQAYEQLSATVPDRLAHSLHLLMVHHGKATCRPSRPRCADCRLASKCPWYARSRES
jgi:endonuclease-3